jgi:mono/diheme cytochrome c family protein
MNHKILTVAIAAASLTAGAALAADKLDASKLPPAAAATGVTYAKDIKPIFEKSCVKCHSGDKAKAKLHLDSLEGALKGGKEAPDIVVGKSGESKLVFAVAHVGDSDDFMPPPDNKVNIAPLTPAEVGLLRAWIDQGAK